MVLWTIQLSDYRYPLSTYHSSKKVHIDVLCILHTTIMKGFLTTLVHPVILQFRQALGRSAYSIRMHVAFDPQNLFRNCGADHRIKWEKCPAIGKNARFRSVNCSRPARSLI